MERMLCVLSGMNAGGAETFLMKIYRELDLSRFQLDFAINEKQKCFYEDEINHLGGFVYRFPAKSKSFLKYVLTLYKIVRNNKYKHVLRITSNAMGFMDLAISKVAGAKKCIARSSNSSGGASLKSKIAHLIGNFLFKRFVDVKIAPSREAAIYTFGKKETELGNVHIIPNGLDINYYQFNDQSRWRVRKEFCIDENTLVLGHVGRFNLQKNHFFLIDVFSSFLKSNPKSKLLLIGDGELKNKIYAKVKALEIEEYVVFAGICSDMPALYSAMDVFVFPSFYEGMPNAVIEAQVCGLHCVVSETITREANITNNVVYLPIDQSSIQKWVECIESCSLVRRIDCGLFSEYDIHNVVNVFEKLIWE